MHDREHLIEHIIMLCDKGLLPTDFIGYNRKELNDILAKLVLGLHVEIKAKV